MRVNGIYYKRFRYCSYCRKRLLSGSGKRINGRLIHKKCISKYLDNKNKALESDLEFFKDLIVEEVEK